MSGLGLEANYIRDELSVPNTEHVKITSENIGKFAYYYYLFNALGSKDLNG